MVKQMQAFQTGGPLVQARTCAHMPAWQRQEMHRSTAGLLSPLSRASRSQA